MKSINMKTWEVQALLIDHKTVTRQVVKQSVIDKFVLSQEGKVLGSFDVSHLEWGTYPTIDDAPYQPGDILYVRETWAFDTGDPEGEIGTGVFVYKADSEESSTSKWRPSIHMPREAARIFLRVTDVRVERLQDITLEGAISEGVDESFMPVFNGYVALYPSQGLSEFWGPEQDQQAKKVVAEVFGSLWDSTFKKKDRALYGWEANPWAWVIEFEKITKEEAENAT